MAKPRIAVVVPVGPEAHHSRWLGECLDSIAAQTRQPDALVAVDDMHDLGDDLLDDLHYNDDGLAIITEVYRPPWRLGVGHAFNHGVARAFALGADIALMLGADDTLEPGALAALEDAYEAHERADGYYWFDTVYQSGEEQRLPCNNAAVTPGFMQRTGGLPVDAACGGMDAALVSALIVHWPEALIHVDGRQARFWSRLHAGQESARLNRYGAAIGIVRDAFTEHFQAPQWGRYT